MRELAEDGYSGIEVRVIPMHNEIIIELLEHRTFLARRGEELVS
uniref:Uncharacterized protein n=1 Tax=Nelumbo nucifera TaxID=4432 RepID=A0A822ZXH1_NELNU|nr:TPA_asm: hypothetical protein HUJ06_018169 [Nelumbo nucifera]